MDRSAEEGKRWLKYGCLGCVAVVAVVVLVVAAVVGAVALQVRGERVEERALSHDVPAPSGAAAEVPAAQAMRVVLELSGGEFHIAPAAPGTPLRVEASYNPTSYELKESVEPAAGGEPATYRVGFRRTGSFLITAIRELLGGQRPEGHIYLPADTPLALDADVSMGGLSGRLDGLWLTEAEIRLDKGGLALDIDAPLRAPVERFVLHGSMGGAAINGLGNASPRRLDVDFSMGGLSLDLHGPWRGDAEISLRTRRSGAAVQLPDGVSFEGLEGFALPPAPASEIPQPTLRFTVDTDDPDNVRFQL